MKYLIFSSLVIMSFSSFAADDWSECSKWLSKGPGLGHQDAPRPKGHFRLFTLSDDGMINPTSEAKHFEEVKPGHYKIHDIGKTHPKGREMHVDIIKEGKGLQVVRKYPKRTYKGMKLVSTTQAYDLINFQILDSGKCVPLNRFYFEHDRENKNETLVAEQELFAPFCKEIYSSLTHKTGDSVNLPKRRVKEIENSYSSKAILEKAKKFIPEIRDVKISKVVGKNTSVKNIYRGCKVQNISPVNFLGNWTGTWDGRKANDIPNSTSYKAKMSSYKKKKESSVKNQ